MDPTTTAGMPVNSSAAHHGKGLCLLSLDAGGARGLSQLKVLAELMHRMRFDVQDDRLERPCAVFDMIGGTGSGGFIAILLVLFGLTVEEALEDFIELSRDVLELQGADADARTTALKAYIAKLTTKRSIPEDMRLMDSNDRSKGCKLVVPISYKHNVGMRCTLRNYTARHEHAPNTTVTEALLATLATPPLFNSTTILNDSDTLEYIGADMTLSNPAYEVISEAYGTFTSDQSVACLLSLGCGRLGVVSTPLDNNLASWNRFLETLVTDGDQKAQTLDSQMGHLGLYYRLSVSAGLGESDQTVSPGSGTIMAHAAAYLGDPSVSRKLDACIGSLKARDGIASLEQLKHSGGESILPPALPPLTRTFVMRKEPWDFMEKAILGTGNPEEKLDGPRMLVVTGIAGCGKTQVVLKFMRVHESEFASRFFIDGSSSARIRADTMAHVRSLGLEYSQSDFDQCLLFLTQPSPNGIRLIVYDNVDDPDLDLGPLLPQGDSCAIIITSRNWSISELCPEAHLELDVMSIEEAVELLLQNPNRSKGVEDRDRDDAVAIAQALGCLPIALTQARSYMYQTKCSGSEYLERLRSSQEKLLAQPVKNQRDMRYTSTYAAFDASFERLAPRTQRLLRLLSYFHWSKFPLDLVVLAAKYDFSERRITYLDRGYEAPAGKEVLEEIFLHEGKWSITGLDEMVVSLQNYSLITLVRGVDTTLVQMHPLAHTWVHSNIPGEEKASLQLGAILLLALGAREDYTPSAQYLASHAMHMSPLWAQLHVNDAEAFGLILLNGGLLEGSLKLRERVVLELRSADSSRVRNLPDALSSLALTYYGSGRLKDAETLQEEGLKLIRETPGDHRSDIILASTRLAVTYNEEGRLKEAERLQLEVLRLSTEALGTRHPRTIKAANNLATTYRDLGKMKEAERIQVDVLTSMKEVLGPRHSDTLWAMGNLGNTYRRLGRNTEAEKLHTEALSLRKEILGDRHPTTLNTVTNLALTYRELGRIKEAEALQAEVLTISKEVLGEKHPDTLKAYGNLALTYCGAGKLQEAEQLQEEVLRLRKEVLGERHPQTLYAASNLATTYRRLERLSDAEAIHVDVLRARTEILGDRHTDTLHTRNNLAYCYLYMGRLEEAETMQVETLRLRQEVSGDRDPKTTNAMLTLAEIYESMGKKALALDVLERADVAISARLGQQHEQYVECQEIRSRVLKLEDSPILGHNSDAGPSRSPKEKVSSSERVEPTPQPRMAAGRTWVGDQPLAPAGFTPSPVSSWTIAIVMTLTSSLAITEQGSPLSSLYTAEPQGPRPLKSLEKSTHKGPRSDQMGQHSEISGSGHNASEQDWYGGDGYGSKSGNSSCSQRVVEVEGDQEAFRGSGSSGEWYLGDIVDDDGSSDTGGGSDTNGGKDDGTGLGDGKKGK